MSLAPAPPVDERRDTASGTATNQRSTGFLLLYALANAGGVIAFLPLLTLLLAIKIEGLAGEARVDLLTATLIAGSIASSTSNILFGWLSDRSVARGGGRRRWIVVGLIGTVLAYAAIALAQSPAAIIWSVVLFQAVLNAVLGPLVAVMADEIPDSQKSTTGGLLSLGYPIASGVLAAVMAVTALGEGGRLMAVVGAAAICLIPLTAVRARPLPIVEQPPATVELQRRDLAVAWVARLLFQLAGCVLQLYLFYYFESIVPDLPKSVLATDVGRLLTISFIAPLPIALVFGRLSDRLDRRKPFLVVAAIVTAIGLAGMAVAHDWTVGAIAFALYTIGYSVFLPLQAAFSMQLLPDPRHRGRDLGLLNLTNTLPSLLGPLLTWWLASPRDFAVVMAMLAVLVLCGGFAMLGVRGRR
uniref:MFS transporter n=1 Tax=Sphingomonas bacterium TaxID=1895847 RepID=UPI00261465A6|nr:MFS transporter [Sphingomonas bacterium]